MSASRSLAFALAGALAVPVAASAEPQWGLPRAQYGYQAAYDEGYQRGVRAGDEDLRRGDEYKYTDESDYRRADVGYRSEYGSRDRYRDEFRRGFQDGYSTAYDRRNGGGIYDRNGRWPRNLPPNANGRGWAIGRSNPASQIGFNDGYQEGLKDGRDRHRNDPIAESRYRSGDHGYDRDFGPKEAYKQDYRQAFRVGYEQGYQDGWRYR